MHPLTSREFFLSYFLQCKYGFLTPKKSFYKITLLVLICSFSSLKVDNLSKFVATHLLITIRLVMVLPRFKLHTTGDLILTNKNGLGLRLEVDFVFPLSQEQEEEPPPKFSQKGRY